MLFKRGDFQNLEIFFSTTVSAREYSYELPQSEIDELNRFISVPVFAPILKENVFNRDSIIYKNILKSDDGKENNDFYIAEEGQEKYKIEEAILEHKVEIFYGTNRKRTASTDYMNFYGSMITQPDDLNIGKCVVSIPSSHKVGRIERPGNLLFWSLRENQNKHIVLDSIRELDDDEFHNEIISSLSLCNEKSFLLFVHGYNNTFAESAYRTAQIAFDVNFKGKAGFFSWPSAGTTLGYIRDMDMASASVTALADFIHSIVEKTGIEKLHIIAHSMGNVLVTSTLKTLVYNRKYENSLAVIDQIVLAAPDIDQDVFKNEILPIFRKVGRNRTMYVSEKDFALKASGILRQLSRVGKGGAYAFVAEDVFTVDASSVIAPDSHSYIFDTKLLLNDLFLVLDGRNHPQSRNLKKNNSELWFFPE